MEHLCCFKDTSASAATVSSPAPFSLSEKPLSTATPCQARTLSARIKAKRDRGEDVDYADLANGEIRHRPQQDSEARSTKYKISPKLNKNSTLLKTEAIHDAENGTVLKESNGIFSQPTTLNKDSLRNCENGAILREGSAIFLVR